MPRACILLHPLNFFSVPCVTRMGRGKTSLCPKLMCLFAGVRTAHYPSVGTVRYWKEQQKSYASSMLRLKW